MWFVIIKNSYILIFFVTLPSYYKHQDTLISSKQALKNYYTLIAAQQEPMVQVKRICKHNCNIINTFIDQKLKKASIETEMTDF